MSMLERTNHLSDTPEKEDKFEPNSKYSEMDEQQLVDWISQIVNSKPKEPGQQAFYEWLKDGQVFSQLMNYVSPGAYTPNEPSKSKLKAKRAMLERENVNYFINAVGSYGVPSKDLFQIPYLYEQQNMYQVQLTLILFKALYEKRRIMNGKQ